MITARRLTLHRAIVCAAVFVSTIAVTAGAQAAEQIGVSAAVRGDVKLIPPGEAGRQATSGGPVNFMETVVSGKESGLQVLLLDETTFTLGPDSEITIDEMVFDPSGADSKLMVTVAQGAFRYLSGDIAKKNPESVTINTPMGSIGIRGTNLFAVETGGEWFFGLLGPGPNNNTGDKPGGFVFQNAQGSADVRRAGYGFSVIPGQAPSAVTAIPPEVFVQFAAAMAEQGGDNGGNGDNGDQANGDQGNGDQGNGDQGNGDQGNGDQGNGDQGNGDQGGGIFAAAADESGQSKAVTLVTVAVQQAVAMVQQDTSAITTTAGQTVDTVTATLPDSYELSPLQYSDVYTYTGTASYKDVGVPMYAGAFPCPTGGCTGSVTAAELQQGFDLLSHLHNTATPVGLYDFTMTADFSKRTVTGSFSAINVNNTITGTAITNASLPFTINYNNKTGTFDATVAAQVPGQASFNLDSGFVFLTSTGAKPFVAEALMITDANWNDLAFGGSIVAPK